MIGRKKKVRLEVEDLNEEGFHNTGADELVAQETEGQLAIDVYQTPDEIVVESTIAGVSAKDIDIDVTSEKVTIHGERVREDAVSGSDYYYQECFWGKFSRSVILPEEIDQEKAHSTLKNGVLTLRLPKLQRDRARKIEVKEN